MTGRSSERPTPRKDSIARRRERRRLPPNSATRTAPPTASAHKRHARRIPCDSGTAAVISRTPGALLLPCTQASVAKLGRQTLAADEQEEADPPDGSRAKARVPRFDDWGTLRPCFMTAYVDTRQCRRSSRCRPSARFAALVGSPEVTPRALRHHPGWRPRARAAIFAPGGVVEQSVVRCPRRSCAQRARIGAPRGIRSVGGPHADRRSPRGL